MNIYLLISIIMSSVVLLGYINQRFVRLPSTIALMASALLISLVMLLLKHTAYSGVAWDTEHLVWQLDFRSLLLDGMLSFLLFAGALMVDVSRIKSQRWEIGILASLGTVTSAVVIACLAYYCLPYLGLRLSWVYCLLFGALISPTDPIAVLAIFKVVNAPPKLTACVAGESLFNDGVGIVLFVSFYALAFQHLPITFSHISILFLKQAVGGLVYGYILGQILAFLIQKNPDFRMAVFVTLAAVTGGYQLALYWGISGALAMVVAGMLVGQYLKKAKTADLYKRLSDFWEIIDEVLNAILFFLIGFELLHITMTRNLLIAGMMSIPLVLMVRWMTVAFPIGLLNFIRKYSPGWMSKRRETLGVKYKEQPYLIRILTWGGLRGGLAVALALSLPPGHARNTILALTYAIVAFSIIVQGITMKPLAKRARIRHATL